eukprot:366130-Chlamydomonas_euryale.AAC.27
MAMCVQNQHALLTHTWQKHRKRLPVVVPDEVLTNNLVNNQVFAARLWGGLLLHGQRRHALCDSARHGTRGGCMLVWGIGHVDKWDAHRHRAGKAASRHGAQQGRAVCMIEEVSSRGHLMTEWCVQGCMDAWGGACGGARRQRRGACLASTHLCSANGVVNGRADLCLERWKRAAALEIVAQRIAQLLY